MGVITQYDHSLETVLPNSIGIYFPDHSSVDIRVVNFLIVLGLHYCALVLSFVMKASFFSKIYLLDKLYDWYKLCSVLDLIDGLLSNFTRMIHCI